MTGIFSFKKVLFFVALFFVPVFVFASTIERVSVDSLGVQSNGASTTSSISGDGRYITFRSFATNLVAGDTNGWSDIFVHDRQTGTTERVSVDSLGNEGDNASDFPHISPDGRYVVFSSGSTNLVPDDTNGGATDVFVHDRQTGTTERVSVDSLGNEGNTSSSDPHVSSDGRYVVFQSTADNLVSGDVNGATDIFVHDRQTGTTERVSVDSFGNEGGGPSGSPAISSDGRYVAFSSWSDLVAGDTNGILDIYVRDRQTGTTERVSVDSLGNESNGFSQLATVSPDGRYVVFESDASNLVSNDSNFKDDVFIHDRQTGTTERVSVDSLGNEGTQDSNLDFSKNSVSSDGRYVVFISVSNNLVVGDTNGVNDIFIHDRQTGITQRASVDSLGNQVSVSSDGGSISSDAGYVGFASSATNLVSGDTNGTIDIFVAGVSFNNTPTNITLTPQTFAENQPSGTTVGALTTTDADVSDTHTYTLACTTPGANDASFSISGSNLVSAQAFNYEDITSYAICIRTSDGNGGTYDENFTITITDVSESSGGSGPGPSNPPTPISGCMDNTASNYNSNATVSGSCTYPPPSVSGCTTSSAVNYNPSATTDNGSCYYNVVIYGCTDSSAENYDSSAESEDGSCIYGEPIDLEEPIIVPDTPTFPDGPSSPENPENTIENGKNESEFPDIPKEILGLIDEVPKEVADTISVAGIALPFIFFLTTQPAAAASIPIRLWNIIPTLLGFKRKKRPWGTVYDSVTKQPLDPVYVKLTDMQGKEVATTITDIDGRFGFLVAPGTYRISANKDNYVFPSKKLFGKTEDDLYNNLYLGEAVTITNQDELLIKNIPMDSIKFNWNEFAKAENKKLMKFYSKRDLFLAKIANITFYAGIISSIVLMFTAPAPLNYIIFAIYAVVIFLRIFGLRPKRPGHVIEKETGYPLSFGLIKIFSSGLQREVAHAVISKTGKYYALVPNGDYYMKVSKKTGEDTYQEVVTTESFRVRGGYVKETLYV